ncbi:MAG: sporulation protein YtfJ [Clostridia bacterium]|nr:sporulation protein YtfJ [Clostridia bacterium]
MSEHPIEGLMITAMNSIKDMVDVNTIIGEPIETSNNIVIIPISKVSFGFASGGSEFKGETIDEYTKRDKEEQVQYRLPFGGGSGAGVTINPIAFLVIQSNNVKLMPVNHTSSLDKLLDYMPDLIEKTNNMMNRHMQNKKEETQKILKEMQKKHDRNMKKQQDDKKEIEDKIEKETNKIEKTIKREPKNNIEETYEFEYDETMEDE